MMDTIKFILYCIESFFILYMLGYSTFLFLSVVVGSSEMYKSYRQKRLKNNLQQDYFIPVSIIVPAYNEEVTVCDTVKSLLSLDYKSYEIVVVDDGSKDDTSKKLIEEFEMFPINRPIRRMIDCKREQFIYETHSQKVHITLIKKNNGGKADAINMGINACNFPYFICMDADSVLQKDALSKITEPILEDESIIAVAGLVRISNDIVFEDGMVKKYRMPKKILPSMQVLEYDRSFLASRILFDRFNGSLIISGAFGLFKKDIVIEAGGYNHDTMGEDMELVVRLHEYCRLNKISYVIKYAIEAICWTQAPESFLDLRKQRKRWHIGLYQSMINHRNLFFNKDYGMVSFISYTYFLLYELLSSFIEVFGVLSMVLAYFVDLINIPFMVLFLGIYAVFSSVMSLTAFYARIYTSNLKIPWRDSAKAVMLCVFEVTALRFSMAWVRFFALFGYKKKKNQWGQIKRKKINVN